MPIKAKIIPLFLISLVDIKSNIWYSKDVGQEAQRNQTQRDRLQRRMKMTMREVAQQVWGLIKCDLDFESWFAECWGPCMEEAIDAILNGVGSFESGTFIELSSGITKDGNPHDISIHKEHFLEYLGEENCWKTFLTLEDIESDLMLYIGGSEISEFYTDEVRELFALCDREWRHLPCDPEGFSPAQEAEADELIEDYVQQIFDKINS